MDDSGGVVPRNVVGDGLTAAASGDPDAISVATSATVDTSGARRRKT